MSTTILNFNDTDSNNQSKISNEDEFDIGEEYFHKLNLPINYPEMSMGTPNPMITPNFNIVTPNFNSKPTENNELESLRKLGKFGLRSQDRKLKLYGYIKYKTVFHILKSFEKKYLSKLTEIFPLRILKKQPKMLCMLICNQELNNLYEIGQILTIFVDDLTQEKSFERQFWQVEQIFFKFQANLSSTLLKSKWQLNQLKRNRNVCINYKVDEDKMNNMSNFELSLPVYDHNISDYKVDINKKFEYITKKYEEKTKSLMYKADDSKLKMQGMDKIDNQEDFQSKIMVLKEKSKINEQDNCNSQTKDKIRFNLVGRLGCKIDYLKSRTKMKLNNLNKDKLTKIPNIPIIKKNIQDDEFQDLNHLNQTQSETSTNTQIKCSNNKPINNKIISDTKLLFEYSKSLRMYKHEITQVSIGSYLNKTPVKQAQQIDCTNVKICNNEVRVFEFKVPLNCIELKIYYSCRTHKNYSTKLMHSIYRNAQFQSETTVVDDVQYVDQCHLIEDLMMVCFKSDDFKLVKVYGFIQDVCLQYSDV